VREISNTKAFTLVELTLVLSLLAFILYLALPQNNFSKNINVRTEVETMHMLITHVHYYALATGQDQELVIDTTRGCYTYRGSNHRLAPGVQFGVSNDIKGPPSSPTHTIESAVTFPQHKIIATAQGALSSGTIYFTDSNTTCFYALSIAVGTCPTIKKYRYDTKQWTILS
jgi:Tfp pilus assembly protein FimT